MGELIKPVSLGLRLFGNILGEDILLGVFSLLGILLTQFILSFAGVEHVWFGIPLHLLLIPIALLGSTIQATVFMVLSTIYIYLVLPHHEGHEEHAHAGAH
jgi:F-type H+-transporting ATPase subunit a